MQHVDVSVLTGSLRQKSLSRKLGRAIAQLASPRLRFSFLELGDMPHYNEDLEGDPPAAYTRFRSAIAASHAVLFVTPEFNRSMPGVLKNAIDVGSRPWGRSVWAGKPAAVISSSPGALGGFGAHHHVRQCLVGVGTATLPHPEAYMSNAHTLFDAEGNLSDARAKDFLVQFVSAFEAWIDQQSRKPS